MGNVRKLEEYFPSLQCQTINTMEEVNKSKEEYIKFFKLIEEFERTGINFVALDLETATMYRNSICEIGIAVVEICARRLPHNLRRME